MPSRDFKRSDRLSGLLRRELGTLVHQIVRDQSLPLTSVSDVEVTKDLDLATVWVTVLDSERSGEAIKALNGLAGELRYQLAGQVNLRRTPELRFKYDQSVDRGERIEQLLRENPPSDTPEA